MTPSSIANLAGRVLLSLIFLMSAVGNKIPNFSQVTEFIASEGVPMPSVMLFGGIVFLVAGSLSIVLGLKARGGAALLLTFLVLATYYFHDFWNFEGEAAQQQMISFMKNLALMGAMLMIMARGSGDLSLDNLKSSTQPASEH